MMLERTMVDGVSCSGERDVHSTYGGGQRTERSQRNDCREHERRGECCSTEPWGTRRIPDGLL